MSSTFVAGYDGSDASRAAVRLAKRLGQHLDARVLVIHVYEPVPFVAGKGENDGARRALQEDIRAAAEHLLDELGEPGVEKRAIPAWSPARGLHDVAEKEGASLMAVGAKPRGPLGRLIHGNVADRLLHGAPCPVAAVPARKGERLSTIAVAYDGGNEARAALRAAQALASAARARLVLLAAMEPDALPAAMAVEALADAEARRRERLQRQLDEAVSHLPAALEVEARVVPGLGAAAIVFACEQGEVDVLVCGSRGYGPLRSVLVGSFSRYLVDHAPCPVLVVPRSAAPQIERLAEVAGVVDVDAPA
jgi:nucleotide-binding universal stress UspA family protein